MITIFTPTYNRAYTLPKLYTSLLNQRCSDFEWVVVDDGSNDQTEALLSNYIQEGKIKIIYKKTSNGGKPRAINKGVQLASGNLFFIVDSDDYLSNDAVEQIVCEAKNINPSIHCGLCFRRMYSSSNEFIGGNVSSIVGDYSSLEIDYKLNIRGDMAEVFYTSILKNYPFPEIAGEKFVPEGLLWTRISQKHKYRFINKGIYCGEYLSDGLTRNFSRNLKRSPRGFFLFYRDQLRYKDVPTIIKCKYLLRMMQCIAYNFMQKKQKLTF